MPRPPIHRDDQLAEFETHEFELFADFHQFYIQDESSKGSLEDAWTAAAMERMVAVADGVIGIGTVRNTTVPVLVQLGHGKPPLDHSCDLAVEAGISIASGSLVVAGCTDYLPTAARVGLAPGMYCARIVFRNLDSISADGLRGDDHYEISLWLEERPTAPQIVIDNRASK